MGLITLPPLDVGEKRNVDSVLSRSNLTKQNVSCGASTVDYSSLPKDRIIPHNFELLHKVSSTYVNAIVLMASRKALSELSATDVNYAEPEKEVEKPTRLCLHVQAFSDEDLDSEGITTGKHSPTKSLVTAGRGSFLSVDIATANGTSMLFENSSVVSLMNNAHRSLSLQRAQQDALFEEAHNLANSFETQAALILQHRNALDEAEGMRLFALIDSHSRDKITMEEILHEASHGATSEAHDVIMRSADTPLSHLRSSATLEALFARLRTQPDGSLGVHEWKDFLALLMLHDHHHQRRRGLATHRAYFGLGRGAPCEDLTVQSSMHEPVLGCIDPAWLADLWYYQCNHHPLLALCLSDAYHPLSRWGRLCVEFAVHGANLFASVVVFHFFALNEGMRYLLAFALVTVPLMVVRAVVLKLLTYCSWHRALSLPRTGLASCVDSTRLLCVLYVLSGVACLVLGVLSAVQVGRGFVPVWVFSWAAGYVASVCWDVCFKFNTLRVCVAFRRLTAGVPCVGRIVQCCSLAQWSVEKKEVLGALCGDYACASVGTSAASESSASGKYSAFQDTKKLEECSEVKERRGSGACDSGRKGSYRYKGYNQSKVLPV